MIDKEQSEVLNSNPSQEYFDIFDETMEQIGIAPRKEAHRRGLWHKVFQCWFFRREGNKTYVILQKRSHLKDTYPNLFDTSAAGHLSAGENIEDGVRELYEELGVSVDYSELTLLDIIKQKKEAKEYKDYQFAYLYIYECNKPLLDYTLQREEVAALVEIELKNFKGLIEGSIKEIEATGITLDDTGINKPSSYIVSFKDLVPHGRDYFQRVYKGILDYIDE